MLDLKILLLTLPAVFKGAADVPAAPEAPGPRPPAAG
jgi:hypothetical protein